MVADGLGRRLLDWLGEGDDATESTLGIACQCVLPCPHLVLIYGCATGVRVLDYHARVRLSGHVVAQRTSES